jgi:hypothetical protein
MLAIARGLLGFFENSYGNLQSETAERSRARG